MKAIRQLETPSGLKLLPKNRAKTRTLFTLGESKPRNGVQQAPVWQDLDKTWQVLLQVQQAGDVQPLLRYCKANPASSAVDREVTESNRQMSGGQRDQLARWLLGPCARLGWPGSPAEPRKGTILGVQ